MKTTLLTAASAALLAMLATSAQAGPINPFDACLNINGAIHHMGLGCFDDVVSDAPGNVSDNIETDANAAESGLGTVQVTLDDVGDFFIGLFVDWDIDSFFFDEASGSGGTLAGGQSFEVDEPGWVDPDDPFFYGGDLDQHFAAGRLDGTVLQNAGAGDSGGPEEDISLALGWDFSLDAGQSATVTFLLSDTQPDSGFWLSHTDPFAEVTFFYSSTLEILGDEPPPPLGVPEPGTLFLLGAALVSARLVRRRQGTPI